MAGYVSVPDFPRQYRRRSGEPALENLCGLWGVGQSTVYRLMDRARRQMAQVLLEPAASAKRLLSLRAAVIGELMRRRGDIDGLGSADWHARQAEMALRDGDAATALWHLWRAQEWPRFARVLHGRASELVGAPETDLLADLALAQTLSPRAAVDLWLARAALARLRGGTEGELRAIERARQAAQAAQEPLLQGIAQGALGKFYESRDTERAVACYQDSVECLRHGGLEPGDVDALVHAITSYYRLAWMYLLRNDERSQGRARPAPRNLRAESPCARQPCWACWSRCGREYWRRSRQPCSARWSTGYRALNDLRTPVGDLTLGARPPG